MQNPSTLFLCLFALGWVVGLYAVSSVLAGRPKKIDFKQALLYVCTLAMLGPVAEICIGSFYQWVFGTPLWNYTIFPIHYAYTSGYAPVVWGLCGLYLYLFHGTPGSPTSVYARYRPILFSLEALALEALVNLTFKLGSGHYIYYYFPADLWHFSSVQALPYSFVGKYFIDAALGTFKTRPVQCAAASVAIIGALVLLS